uniref:ANK_REP_REGION domain-containing protein n=1 Tax=Macrostomum lignano TaxID=282301 RepID=A0A1I8GXH6_9PLAT
SDIRTKSGKSPLHIAAKSGHDRVVELLLEARCTIRPHALDGNTPLELSLAQNHLPVARRLRRAQENFDYCAADSEVIKDSTDIPPVLQPEANLSSKRFEQNSKRFRTKPYLVRFENLTKYGPQPEDTELSLQLHAALTKSGFSETRAAMQSAMADVLETILRNRLNDNEVFVVGSYSEGWGNSLTRMDGRTDFESDIDVVQLMPGRLYHVRRFCQCPNANSRQTTSYYNGHIECEGFASNPARPENGSTLRPAVDRVSACRLCCYPPIGPLQPHRLAKSSIPQTVLQSLTSELEASPCHVVHAAPPGQAGKQLRVSTTFLERRLLRSLTTLQGQLFVTLKFLVKKVIGRRVHGLKAYHAKTVTFRMLEETPEEQWKPENLMTLIRRSVQMLLDSVETSRSADNTDGRIMEHFFLSDAALYLKGADRSSFEEIVQVLRDVIDHLPQLLMSFNEYLKPVSAEGMFYFHPFLILPILLWNPDQKSNEPAYHKVYNLVRESLLSLFEVNYEGGEALTTLFEQLDRLPYCARSARQSLKALSCLMFDDLSTAVEFLTDCRAHQCLRLELTPGDYQAVNWLKEISQRDDADEVEQRILSSQLFMPIARRNVYSCQTVEVLQAKQAFSFVLRLLGSFAAILLRRVRTLSFLLVGLCPLNVTPLPQQMQQVLGADPASGLSRLHQRGQALAVLQPLSIERHQRQKPHVVLSGCQMRSRVARLAQADVELQDERGFSPLYMAAQFGHSEVVKALIKSQADVNVLWKFSLAPLHIAAQENHQETVDLLIGAQANVDVQRDTGESPLHLAVHWGHGHTDITNLLLSSKADSDIRTKSGKSPLHIAAKPQPEDTELSLQLHAALTKSGFSETRAAMQSAMADVLETILRNRLNDNEVFVVGSYSEGWGNSLTRMDGRTDFESDIDVVQLMPGRLYHVRRFCQCPNANSRQTTTRPENGSTLRPAVDRVSACRLCCYPPIGPLQPHRLAKSSIPQTVLQSLTSELEASPC